jgi:hypothetical protein
MSWFCYSKLERQLKRINRSLRRIARALEDEEEAPHDLFFAYSIGPVSPKERMHMPLTVTTTNEEQITIAVNPTTTTGQPAQLDGPITVTSIGGDSTVSLVDDRTFRLRSSDNPGDSSFLVEADADLGGGVVLIQDTVTYTVLGALAANLGLTPGLIEPKTP